jgi:hypothetical protein
MTRLNVVVEGQAEETYVNQVLALHLTSFNVGAIARRVEFSRKREKIHRGGLLDYPKLRKDVMNWLNQDRRAMVTTMVDLYALPDSFPKRDQARRIADPHARVVFLEQAFAEDIGSSRFIPNLQLHEFEAILFTDIGRLRLYYPKHDSQIAALETEASHYANPELINEGATTAPSKRILRAVPQYEKVLAGSLIAIDLGLSLIRPSCTHFHEWIAKLEALHTTA